MSVVYFIKPVGQLGPIKIGFTVRVAHRLHDHEVQSPLLLELICTAPGGPQDERLVHECFADQQMHGEWFAWSKGLQAVIDHVGATGALPELKRPWPRPTLGRNSNGNACVSRAKANITRRVNDAERMRYRWPERVIRPDEIQHLISSYQGAHKPAPSADQINLLERYIHQLRNPQAEQLVAA